MAIGHIDDPVAEVIELRARLDIATDALKDALTLNQRVDLLLARITGPAPLSEVRAAMNDVGIHDARRRLEVDAVDAVENALLDLRLKQQAERDARDAHAEAVTEAAWSLGAHFASRSNKTWLVRTIDGEPIAEADQQSYDAKAKAEWVDFHAARTQTVHLAARALRDAEENTRTAADAVTITEKRFTAAKHSVDAAAAQLHALVRATPREDLR